MEEGYRKVRYKLYEKITAEIEEINAEIAWSGVQITTNPEYVPDYLNEIVEQLVLLWELDTSTFVYGSGKRKSKEQRHYEHLTTFCQKLQEYIQKMKSVVLIETVTLKQITQLPLCVSKRITWAMISFCQHIMYRLV